MARSSLETQVVSTMRSLRQRGRMERNGLARRLGSDGTEGLNRVPGLRRIASVVSDGKASPSVSGNVPTGR